ncbi:hypothetical protein K474DRAFT_1713759, partial [Panus rudis PR-1116 ss-1]
GTWAFLSAPRLQFPGKPWELADDLESFVHLVNWFTLRFHNHSLSRQRLVSYLRGRYQTCNYHSKIEAYSGCEDKIEDVASANPRFKLLANSQGYPTNLASMIEELMKLAQQHWLSIDQDAYVAYRVPNDKLISKPSEEDEEEQWVTPEETAEDVDQPALSTGGVRPVSPFKDHKEIIRVVLNIVP